MAGYKTNAIYGLRSRYRSRKNKKKERKRKWRKRERERDREKERARKYVKIKKQQRRMGGTKGLHPLETSFQKAMFESEPQGFAFCQLFAVFYFVLVVCINLGSDVTTAK